MGVIEGGANIMRFPKRVRHTQKHIVRAVLNMPTRRAPNEPTHSGQVEGKRLAIERKHPTGLADRKGTPTHRKGTLSRAKFAAKNRGNEFRPGRSKGNT